MTNTVIGGFASLRTIAAWALVVLAVLAAAIEVLADSVAAVAAALRCSLAIASKHIHP